MGVRIQRPGDPGHPGGNRRVYVRVNHEGLRKTRVFNTSKAAEEYASTVEAMLKLGQIEGVFPTPELVTPPPPTPTFAEAKERWLAVDGATFKGGTLDSYRNILKVHVSPVFDHAAMATITRTDVEGWWAGILAKKLSVQRLMNIRSVVVGVFRRAVKSGMIVSNPADVIAGHLGREDREVRQAEWLTEMELRNTLAVAVGRERLYPALLTLASTGIRLGEGLGLQVGDVDLERNRLSIRRSVRKRHVGSPKSRKPRTVDVPPSTAAVLKGWIAIIRAEAAVRGVEASWLFPGTDGNPQDGILVRQAFRRCLEAAGIPRKLRLHDLRHTYASLAI